MTKTNMKSEASRGWIARVFTVLTGELLITLLLLSLIPLLILGVTVYFYASRLQSEQAEASLVEKRISKSVQIERYFETVHDQVRVFSENLMVVNAMKEFTEAFNQLDKNGYEQSEQYEVLRDQLKSFYSTEFATRYREETGADPAVESIVQPMAFEALYLQSQYIVQNDNALGEKDRLKDAEDGSTYSEVHSRYHDVLRRYRETFGFYDVFLVDAKTSNVVYSVFKEADFATSLRRGPFSSSNLATTVSQASDSGWSDFVAFSDYKPYEPSYRNAASFIASPIFSNGEKIGILVFQMPIDQIDQIVQPDEISENGDELYVVGIDSLIRNNLQSKDGNEAKILKTRVETAGATRPFSEESQTGVGRFPGRKGEVSLQTWARVVVHPGGSDGNTVTWALVSEVPVTVVERPTKQIFWFTVLVTGISAALVSVVAIAISRRFTAQQSRQQDLVLAIGDNMHTLASASEELTSVSEHMSSAAEETTAQARVVSEAADHVSDNTRNVSTGLETFSISVREVATSAGEAAVVANRAVDVAKTADASINKLDESSQRIGEVVSVITSIAEQTNLLALNATIEAARAGEAGKGFAVVAGEVKELAKETAAATNNIRDSIDLIREDTQRAVEAISDITSIVDSICQQENTIASAVEQQTSTTTEISRNLAESAAGTAQIAQNMTQVAQAAQGTAEGASNTQAAAIDLSRMASNLQRLVEEYRER